MTYGPSSPLIVLEMVRTSDAAPSQWEGVAATGDRVYVRYRHGRLTVSAGPTIDEAVAADPLVDEHYGTLYDSVVEYGQLQSRVPDWVRFPATDRSA